MQLKNDTGYVWNVCHRIQNVKEKKKSYNSPRFRPKFLRKNVAHYREFCDVKTACICSSEKKFLALLQNAALLMTQLEIQGCPDDSFGL